MTFLQCITVKSTVIIKFSNPTVGFPPNTLIPPFLYFFLKPLMVKTVCAQTCKANKHSRSGNVIM